MWDGWIRSFLGEASSQLTALHFEFASPIGTGFALLLILATGVGIGLFSWSRLGSLSRPMRLFLSLLRVAILALALFLVLDPRLVGERIKAAQNCVLLLFDDSKSMRVSGSDGRTRGDRLVEEYMANKLLFEDKLEARYIVASYRFGESVERFEDVQELDFARNETDIPGSVQSSLDEFRDTNAVAVVLFSDGVQQTSGPPTEPPEELRDGIPVFTVGTGRESEWRDVGISNLSVRRSNFDKSPVQLGVTVRSVGLQGRRIVVEVLDGNRVVQAELLEVTEDPQDHQVQMEFIPERKGWIEYRARVRLGDRRPRPGSPAEEDLSVSNQDPVMENNTSEFIVDNREKGYRILYFSGRPNWQNKFVRGALQEDEQLKVTSLVRVSEAEKKFVFRGLRTTVANPLFDGFEEEEAEARYDEDVFLRIGGGESDLGKGYPARQEDLFPYQLVIWGDVEHSFFSQNQLEITRDFVSKRGGSLLLLGGPRAFTEGGYAGSLIEPMLPVLLHEQGSGVGFDPESRELILVQPTIEGELTGSWTLDPDPEEDQKLWDELPPLTGLNRFLTTRPGATTFARAISGDTDADKDLFFAVQRYGEGKCAVLSSGETWQWRMGLDEKDERHHRLWRQIVRRLVNAVPEPIFLRDKEDVYTVGVPAKLEVVIRDELFEEREGVQTTVELATPSGENISLPVEESIREAGLYTVEFVPDTAGMHKVRVETTNEKGEIIGRVEDTVLAKGDDREFRNPQYNPAYLRELAARTGGKFFELDELSKVADEIPRIQHAEVEVVQIPLWHYPGFYFLLIAMLVTEWYVRRRKGHA